jgi:L-ascorbate metabolism protein UlaG (beta-lactamase superfamily)
MRPLPCIALLFLLACNPATQQEETTADTPDLLNVATIHPIHHSALVLQWNGLSIMVDPPDGAERFSVHPAPDLVLITDIHGDHLDTTTLRSMDLRRANILAPRAVILSLPQELQAKAILVQNGDEVAVKGVRVAGIPMYNRPGDGDPRHPKGRGNGYVITLGDQRIYISGDTEDITEMRSLRNIDVAFVCMNLPYTMTVEQAAAGVLAFKPRVVYPYHYRGNDGYSDVARFKELVHAGEPSIEVRLVDWYAQ